ncbi:MAG: hypothetical protein LDL06_01120 [Candidatus Nitrosotenuis sp.]|nr:hypothetical protein [Candidatus Nitrosotenuis sp.]
MVWFRYKTNELGFFQKKSTVKFIKRFQKNGTPNIEYFGAGMYANYLYEPVRKTIQLCEIYPNLVENKMTLNHIITDESRSFEIYKQAGTDNIRLAVRSSIDDIEGFVKALNVDYEKKNEKILPISDEVSDITNEEYCFFDFELVRQFNFTILAKNQQPIIDKLIQAMTANRNSGIMIQFVFTKSLNWNKIAETTAENLSRYLKDAEKKKIKTSINGFGPYLIPRLVLKEYPNHNELASSAYQIGKKIEKMYHLKASSTPYTLAIRGMIRGKRTEIQNTLQNISSVFASLEFVGDSLNCFVYDIDYDRGISWIENNSIISDYSMRILKENSDMWSDMRWGKGRDFVPFLCLTAEEFPVFVSMPTDPTLPLSYRRKTLRGLSHDKFVFRLGIPI